MSDTIKDADYFAQGFRELDETLSETTSMLAGALPLDAELRSLIPWRNDDAFPESIPSGHEREGAQLLSICFELLNIVEERVAWQFRSQRRAKHGAAAIKGLWPSVINKFIEEGLTEADAIEALKKVQVEPVLTAHPTEAKRPSVRKRHQAIYEELRTFENARRDPHFGRRVSDTLGAELETLWYTGEIFVKRPNIQEELHNAMPYLSEIFPEVVNRLDRSLELAWQDAGWDVANLRKENAYPKLRFATWIGGDRDGHSLVTPEVTESTLAELHQNAKILHRRSLLSVSEKLTLASPFAKIPTRLSDAISELSRLLGEEGARIATRYQLEPWRAHLNLLREKFEQRKYQTSAEYLADLQLSHDALCEVGATRTAHEWIFPLMRRGEIFGLHLASLDIRNNSESHDEAAAQLFKAVGIEDGENFPTWSEEKRRELLVAELANPRPFLSRYELAGDKADGVLAYLRNVATHLRKKGQEGLGQLIISMTRSVSDLLLMQVLAREAGLAQMQENGLWRSRLPVSPLFETGEDLAAANGVLSEYLKIMGPHPSGRQPAMVGYSDSNKDAGVFASQWGIFQGQEAMTAACKAEGVVPQFFHGRGGTIGRGAGPTRWFLRALPEDSLCGPVRITEQGEVLPRKYGHEGNAHLHLELLIAGVTRSVGLGRRNPTPVNECRVALDALSHESDKAYRSLLDADQFMEFYRTATPIDALETGVFGSRPSRRSGKKASLKDLRAIPWVFSWTQARFYLPGWYGVGSGLEAIGEENFSKIKEAFPNFDFLRYVFTNIESSLASANPEMMKQYAALCPDKEVEDRFLNQILEEYEKTQYFVNELFGREFDDRRPRMEKTLALREVPLRALHNQQIDLLKRWRADGSSIEAEDGRFNRDFLALQLTINAVSSGLRETG
ncbi:phosphoenolpyruvate carboxylase [Akkermansiaceae bacterium]|nr:phosphoenolpyruvate carboxylase [Akkermansiaceae bacterium]